MFTTRIKFNGLSVEALKDRSNWLYDRLGYAASKLTETYDPSDGEWKIFSYFENESEIVTEFIIYGHDKLAAEFKLRFR